MLLYSKVREVLTVLRKVDLRGVMMSGSGSTCFGLANSFEEAEKIAKRIQGDYSEWWARATYTV
jgi:4-diphosphocytidyl-2-C-methyl-D-erythritol kinase